MWRLGFVTLAAAAFLVQVSAASAEEAKMVAQASTGSSPAPSATPSPAPSTTPSATTAKPTGKGVARIVKIHGTIDAIDKDKGTVTLKGPKGGKLTLDVQDKSKFDVIKVGDPVVATYVEAVAFQLAKSGATPGTTTQESRVTSKPGETPAGAIGRTITVTATIVAINTKAQTVTIKGPEGNTETIKAQDPKNLKLVKVGDLIDITYAQALAVSLDKPATK